MHTPQLHALGFDTPSIDDLVTRALAAGLRGAKVPGFSLLAAYTDPSGARLALLQREGQPVTTTGALRSETAYRAQVVRFTDVLARVALYGEGGEGPLLAQFLAMVDDPFIYPAHDLRDPSQFSISERLLVGALAIDVEVHEDEAAFLASPSSKSGALQLSVETLMSPGLVGLQAAAIGPQEATPTLLMAVTVEAVEVRTNQLTGVDFQFVRGNGAVTLSCAVPLDHRVAVGNVVFGTWFGTCSSGVWDSDQDSAGD